MFTNSIINLIYVLISIVICIFTFVLIQKRRKRIFLLLPIFNFILASVIQFFDILWYGNLWYGNYMINENFFEVYRLYFSNDSSMAFVFCYIPWIVVGTIIPLVAIAIFYLKQKKNNIN